MPHRLILAYEAFVCIVAAVFFSAINLLTSASQLFVMAEATNNKEAFDAALADYDYTRWLLLPFIGAFISSAILLSWSVVRKKRECFPSACFSIAASVIVTQLVEFLMERFSTTKELLVYPHAIVGIGFVLSIIFYALAEPAIKRFLDNSTKIADNIVDEATERAEEYLRKSKNRKNRNE